MEVKKVKTEEIRKLRHKTLRKGFPFSSTIYDKDDEKKTFHLAQINQQKIITCATFYPEKNKILKAKNPYRLRGMATDQKYRRKGCGKRVMLEAFIKLKKLNCDVLWCNARIIAIDFYKELGFKIEGKIFNIEGIGPHYLMQKKIR